MNPLQREGADARSLRRWCVAALGAVLVSAATAHFLGHEATDPLVAAATVLPAVALVVFGVWFALRTPAGESGTAVFAWAVGGAGLVLALDLWGVTVGAYGATPRIGHVVIQHTSVGAFGGAVAGTYSERARRRAHSHLRLRRALDAAMDGVAVLDGDGYVVYANDAYNRYYSSADASADATAHTASATAVDGGADTGENANALAGNHWQVAYAADSRERISEVVAALESDSDHWRGTVEARRADGSTYPQDLSMTALDEGYVWVCRDATDREERDQRLQVLNRVLRHNVRNGMNVVLGRVESIEDRHGGSEAVESVRDTAVGVLAVSEKAREVERALATDDATTREDVTGIVTREVERASEEYPEAVFDVTVNGEASTERRLRLVVRELLVNAVEHNEADDPSVSVSVDTAEAVVLTVEDNGSGIPEQERRALEGQTETPLQHGSGIGLWLVYWLVHHAGGTVDVRDDGSITVHLPRERTIHTG